MNFKTTASPRAIALAAFTAAFTFTLAAPANAQSHGRLDRSFDRDFQQARKSSQKPDDAGSGSIEATSVPGTTVYAGAAAVGGYDSNIDLSSTGKKGSGFAGIDAGVGAVVARDHSETTLAVRGSDTRYSIDYRPDRWDAGAFADHRIALQNGMKLTLGGFYYRDEIEVDRSQRIAGYGSFDHETETTDSFVRLRALNRDYLNAPGTLLPNSILSAVNSSFSNTRTELAGGMLWMKDHRISPFVQVGGAVIDFNHQISGGRNRNSQEAFAIAGIRTHFSKDFYADIGGRFNARSMADLNLGHHNSAFFDGKLVWQPSKAFTGELAVERTNQDPLAAGALFSEVTAVRLSLTGRPTSEVRGALEAGFERLDQIGAGFHYNERYLEGRLGYQLTPRSEVFGFGRAINTSSSRDSTQNTDSYRVGLGFKLHN